jgi:hypothetical protein
MSSYPSWEYGSNETDLFPPTTRAFGNPRPSIMAFTKKVSLDFLMRSNTAIIESRNAYIIFPPYFKMDTTIVPPKHFNKKDMQTATTIPAAKGGVETTYPFQWLLFKPQNHAVVPFQTNQASRNENTSRK